MTTRGRKAVFPVAGLGTRFLPATKAMPKEMLTVVDRPLIQYAVDEAREAGIEEFIFVTGRGKAALEDHFDHAYELEDTLKLRNKEAELKGLASWQPAPGQVAYTRQQTPLGLGHAVLCARPLVGDEPFAVLLPDDLVLAPQKGCLKQMIETFNEQPANIVAIEEVPREHTNRYGVLDVASDDGKMVKVKGVVEKPQPKDAPSTLTIIGRYVLEPQVFDHLTQIGRGAGGEIQLTDGLARLIADRRPFFGLRFDGKRFDCGDKIGFFEANLAFALARPDMRDSIQRILSKYR
ncbi:MAG TPA: UTP--glucose-1-phosphate uridylyltransferase GalU [Stellaceae bacterium]|nr:UTP--glucose-1-phosphate uridylyltransferase GalU [Stellaceae bacterium]